MERDNLTEEEVRRRMAAQPTNLEYIQQANVIFSTQWEPEYTQKQVRNLFVCMHVIVEPFLQVCIMIIIICSMVTRDLELCTCTCILVHVVH